MSSILSLAPADLVDFFFNFERFEIVEFRLVRLELGMKAVLTALLFARGMTGITPLKHHYTSALSLIHI